MEPISTPVRVRRSLRPAVIGGIGLLVVVAIGAAIWLFASSFPPPAARLKPEIIASLASQGTNVSELPPETSVQITRAQAETIFHEQNQNRLGVTTTTVLAKVVSPRNPQYDCTCWLVSFLIGTGIPPQGGPPGGKLPASMFTSMMRYHVTFIDAYTGKFYYSHESYYPLYPSPSP